MKVTEVSKADMKLTSAIRPHEALFLSYETYYVVTTPLAWATVMARLSDYFFTQNQT